jgi:hypothetical protein
LFIASKLISYFLFNTALTKAILSGRLFIVIGGAIITIGTLR